MNLRENLIEFAKWYEKKNFPDVSTDDWDFELDVDAFLKDKPVTDLNERNSVDEGEKSFVVCSNCPVYEVGDKIPHCCQDEKETNDF